MGAIGVAEEQYGVGGEGAQGGAETGIVQAGEAGDVGARGDVGDKLVGIAGEQVGIPGEGGAELGVWAGGQAVVGEVKYLQVQAWFGSEVPKPRSVVLDRVRHDDGEATKWGRGCGARHRRTYPEVNLR